MFYTKYIADSDDDRELVFSPVEVKVRNGNFDEAFRKFRTLVQSEGILKELKKRESHEPHSEKKRRKAREAVYARLAEAAREEAIASGEYQKRLDKKEAKRQAKMEARRKLREEESGTTND